MEIPTPSGDSIAKCFNFLAERPVKIGIWVFLNSATILYLLDQDGYPPLFQIGLLGMSMGVTLIVISLVSSNYRKFMGKRKIAAQKAERYKIIQDKIEELDEAEYELVCQLYGSGKTRIFLNRSDPRYKLAVHLCDRKLLKQSFGNNTFFTREEVAEVTKYMLQEYRKNQKPEE